MVFTEQQLQVKKLVDVQQDIEIDALNDGVGALSSTMQNGFTEAANNFSDIQNSLGLMNNLSDERYNGLTGSINTLSNAMTQGFLDMGNTVANVADGIQGQLNQMNANAGNTNDNIQNQFNGVNIELQNIQNTFELVNTNIGESINAYNDQIKNSLSVDTLSANTLIYNISEKPVSSLTALGYDSNGRVIPVTVIANHNIVLPENAKYLYTDAVGAPHAGNVDNVVSESENLVTSHAVYNEVSTLQNDISFTNELMNLVMFFSGGANSMYHISPGKNLSISTMPNYTNVEKIEFGKGLGSFENLCAESPFGVYFNWDDNTNILRFYSPLGPDNIHFNYNMDSTFAYCSKLNQNIKLTLEEYSVGDRIEIINNCFMYCTNFDQNIQLPYTCENYYRTFMNCSKLNQNILIPLNSNEVRYMFMYCTNLNQNIRIPTNARTIDGMFFGCYNLNQQFNIPSNVVEMNRTFMECNSFNCPVHTPVNLMYMQSAYEGCTNLRENIYIHSVKMANDGMLNAFLNCPLPGKKYIHIPKAVPMDTSNNFYNCLVNNYTGVNWTGHVVNDL